MWVTGHGLSWNAGSFHRGTEKWLFYNLFSHFNILVDIVKMIATFSFHQGYFLTLNISHQKVHCHHNYNVTEWCRILSVCCEYDWLIKNAGLSLWQGRREVGREDRSECWEKEGQSREKPWSHCWRQTLGTLPGKPQSHGDTQINGYGLN